MNALALFTRTLDTSKDVESDIGIPIAWPVRMGYTQNMPAVVHPHIAIDPNICGGNPRIEGTRITVRTIVIYALHHGQTPEELLTHYPHISLASIYDALSYYYDNREALDKDIAEHLSAPEIDSRS